MIFCEESLPSSSPNITLARAKLDGWEPKVPLKEGLKRTIAYFDELLKKIGNGRKA